MNGFENDRRSMPYSNNRMLSPTMIWGIIVFVVTQTATIAYWGAGVEAGLAALTQKEAQDIQHFYQGKKLGDALKKAYEVQLDESIDDKKLLLQKLTA